MPSKKKKSVSNEDLLEAMGKGFQSVENRMATKEALAEVWLHMATKDDLRKVEERLTDKLETHDKVERDLIKDLQTRVKKLETHVFKTP